MDTTILTRHDTGEHIRSPLCERKHGLDHGVGYPRSLCGMPPYAPLKSRRCSRKSLRCCVISCLGHGSRARRDRMVPSPAPILSIPTRNTRCLISPCKIPANWPYHPQRGSRHGRHEPCRKMHIPSLLVVNWWAADGESGSHYDFWCRHDVWMMIFHQVSERIT